MHLMFCILYYGANSTRINFHRVGRKDLISERSLRRKQAPVVSDYLVQEKRGKHHCCPPPFKTKPQPKSTVQLVTDFFHREGLSSLLNVSLHCNFCTHSTLDPNNEMLSLLIMQCRKLTISYLKCIGTNNSSNVNIWVRKLQCVRDLFLFLILTYTTP